MLGHAAPRPEAPFEWSNAWGADVSVLVIWFVVGWWTYGGPYRRVVAVLALATAAVPVVYSLNRGLWIGLGISAAYVMIRGARPLLAGAVAAVAAAAFLLSPLSTIVAQRLDNPRATASARSRSRPPSGSRRRRRSSATATRAPRTAATAR